MGLERGYPALDEDAESRNVGRIADRTAGRLVVRNGETLATRRQKKKRWNGQEGKREKWRPRAEITFVFLI